MLVKGKANSSLSVRPYTWSFKDSLEGEGQAGLAEVLLFSSSLNKNKARPVPALCCLSKFEVACIYWCVVCLFKIQIILQVLATLVNMPYYTPLQSLRNPPFFGGGIHHIQSQRTQFSKKVNAWLYISFLANYALRYFIQTALSGLWMHGILQSGFLDGSKQASNCYNAGVNIIFIKQPLTGAMVGRLHALQHLI